MLGSDLFIEGVKGLWNSKRDRKIRGYLGILFRSCGDDYAGGFDGDDGLIFDSNSGGIFLLPYFLLLIACLPPCLHPTTINSAMKIQVREGGREEKVQS